MDEWSAKPASPPIPRIKTLSARSDLRGLWQLSSQLAAIGVTSALLAAWWPRWWAILPFFLQGVLLNCLYAGQHETSHRTAFRSRWINEVVGEIIGFLNIYPARWDRYFHLAHHRYTQDWQKDPELLVRGPYSTLSWLLTMCGYLYWRGRIQSTLRTARGRFAPYVHWLTPAQAREVIVEARWHVAGYVVVLAVSLALHSWAAVEFWLGPLLLTKFVHQFQNVGEHTALTHEPDTLRNTRTLRAPWLVRWLLWNMTYHAAHHTYPGVPFHALPDLQQEIVAYRPMPETTHLEAQRDIRDALRSTDHCVAV